MSEMKIKDSSKKMVGAYVDRSLYWAFKETAAKRAENMNEAIYNALNLYIDLKPEEPTKLAKEEHVDEPN